MERTAPTLPEGTPRTQMEEACAEFLAAFREGQIDKSTFIKTVLNLGPHEYPRNYYERRIAEQEHAYERHKHLEKNDPVRVKIRDSIAYWKNILAGWDFWAAMCEAYGVEIRPHKKDEYAA